RGQSGGGAGTAARRRRLYPGRQERRYRPHLCRRGGQSGYRSRAGGGNPLAEAGGKAAGGLKSAGGCRSVTYISSGNGFNSANDFQRSAGRTGRHFDASDGGSPGGACNSGGGSGSSAIRESGSGAAAVFESGSESGSGSGRR